MCTFWKGPDPVKTDVPGAEYLPWNRAKFKLSVVDDDAGGSEWLSAPEVIY